MKLSDSVVQDLRDLFSEVGFEGSLEDCLDELSALVARMLSAKGCTIILLTDEEAMRTEISERAGFGFLPGTPARLRKSLSHLAMPTFPKPALAGGSEARVDSMFSTIVLKGKVVGLIQAVLPQQHNSFSKDDLDLFSILTPIITKSIQVIQLQQLLKSRFTQAALGKSGDASAQEMLSGVMRNPNQIARILAKSFYREMLNAGFNINQIIFAATEVISELSASVRKHGARRKKRIMEGKEQPDKLWEGLQDEVAASPGAKAGEHVQRIPA
ncbi:hypothetical protein [Massilia niastensis]|uniref:hypothetical protein n=1 Tax=Massilia niastensis TaxID=544911 RepID=UPI00036C60D4|nr:hypothetical protein [Massilia niastensis]